MQDHLLHVSRLVAFLSGQHLGVFLQSLSPPKCVQEATQANWYELQLGRQAKDEFGAKADLVKQETTAQQQFQESEQAKAGAEGSKVFRRDYVPLCEQKENDFAARQQLRADKIESKGKAIEGIGSKSVSGAGDKHLPAMLLQRPSLAQL